MSRTQVLPKISSNNVFKIFIILILLCFISSLSGCYFFPQEEEVLAPPLKVPEQLVYKTVKVEKGNIEKRVNATGYFISDSQTDLFFKQRGGRIETINVKTGDMVDVGDILIQLETDNLETQIIQQEIAFEKLKLNYNQNLSNAKRTISLSELQLEDLNIKLDRLKKRIEDIPEDLSIQDVMPGADTEAELLEEQIKKQEIEIEGEREKYKNIEEMMELDIRTAEMQIDGLKSELEKTRLITPLAGRVVWLTSSKAGEYIYAHTNLIRIADVTKLKLRYTGDNISDFKINNIVEVKIEDNLYEGIVVMTPSTAPFDLDENIKRSVLIDVKGLPSGVKLGDSARIGLLLDKKEDVVIIPRSLLHGFMGQKTVYILEDGIKIDRNVQVGIETPTEVEIIKGLEEGEEIIIN